MSANWETDPDVSKQVYRLLADSEEAKCVVLYYDEHGKLTHGPVLIEFDLLARRLVADEQLQTNRGIPGVRYVLENVDLPQSAIDAAIASGADEEQTPISTWETVALIRRNGTQWQLATTPSKN